MQINNKEYNLPVAGAGHRNRLLPIVLSLCLLMVLGACGGEATGMQRPIDGSSVSAYEATEETLRSELTAAQFSDYKRSVNYLQLKAFDAPSISDFYLTLDGKTPEQVIEQAEAARSGS